MNLIAISRDGDSIAKNENTLARGLLTIQSNKTGLKQKDVPFDVTVAGLEDRLLVEDPLQLTTLFPTPASTPEICRWRW